MTEAEQRRQDYRKTMMLTESLPKIITKMAAPSIVSFLITSIYNLADTFFVSSLGTNATAAVSVNASLDQIIMMAGSLLAVGYEKVFLLQTDANLSSSEVISTYVYKYGLVNNDYGFSTAVGLFNSVINSALLIAVNCIARRVGETSLW